MLVHFWHPTGSPTIRCSTMIKQLSITSLRKAQVEAIYMRLLRGCWLRAGTQLDFFFCLPRCGVLDTHRYRNYGKSINTDLFTFWGGWVGCLLVGMWHEATSNNWRTRQTLRSGKRKTSTPTLAETLVHFWHPTGSPTLKVSSSNFELSSMISPVYKARAQICKSPKFFWWPSLKL